MENINVYVRCRYSEGTDYLLSREATAFVWDYLISNRCFCDSLDSLISKMEFSTNMSKQTLKELRVDVHFKEEELAIELTLRTKENCTLKLEEFRIVFDDIKEIPEVIKKGCIAKDTILKEKNGVEERIKKSLLLGIGSCIIIVFIYFVLSGCFDILYPVLLVGVLPFTFLITVTISFLPLDLYQPKETEFKTKLNIESLKQNVS